MWWADQGTDQIGTCDKKDGGSWKVLRNSTSPMMHMKIYNETVQKGTALPAANTHTSFISAFRNVLVKMLEKKWEEVQFSCSMSPENLSNSTFVYVFVTPL